MGFDASDGVPVFGEAQMVNYSNKYPVVDFFNTPNDEQIDLVYLTKHEDWICEKEWRIINHGNDCSGVKEYRVNLLESIYFGMRMTERDKVKIKEWVAK